MKDPRIKPFCPLWLGTVNVNLQGGPNLSKILSDFGVYENNLDTGIVLNYDGTILFYQTSDNGKIFELLSKTRNVQRVELEPGYTKNTIEITKNEFKNIQNDIITDLLRSNNGAVLATMVADDSGITHKYIIKGVTQKNGRSYIKLWESHAGDKDNPTTWNFYHTMTMEKDGSLFISVDELFEKLVIFTSLNKKSNTVMSDNSNVVAKKSVHNQPSISLQ